MSHGSEHGGGPIHGRRKASPTPASADLPLKELREASRQLERLDIFNLLHLMVDRGASDLHIKVGMAPGLRIDGELRSIGGAVLTAKDTGRLVEDLLTPEQFETFGQVRDMDLSFSVPDLSRFRVNVLTQRGTAGMVIRRIPNEIPTIEQLGLPSICRAMAELPRGLVLVTGPTGSGKSTTLAAMIDHVNGVKRGHIVTMEDPIEFVHRDRKCWVTQREIGSDALDFASALKRALRQDPDVILVGEMRDLETISLAVTAAETGHLVFATLHTTSAVQTVNRIVDVFPPAQQAQIRMQIADNLQGVISQTLVPRIPRGRIAAMEVLVGTDGVRALVREGKTAQLHNLIQTGGRDGMQTLEAGLNQLVAAGKISVETALAVANVPNQIKVRAEPPQPAEPEPPPDPGSPARANYVRRRPNYGV